MKGRWRARGENTIVSDIFSPAKQFSRSITYIMHTAEQPTTITHTIHTISQKKDAAARPSCSRHVASMFVSLVQTEKATGLTFSSSLLTKHYKHISLKCTGNLLQLISLSQKRLIHSFCIFGLMDWCHNAGYFFCSCLLWSLLCLLAAGDGIQRKYRHRFWYFSCKAQGWHFPSVWGFEKSSHQFSCPWGLNNVQCFVLFDFSLFE